MRVPRAESFHGEPKEQERKCRGGGAEGVGYHVSDIKATAPPSKKRFCELREFHEHAPHRRGKKGNEGGGEAPDAPRQGEPKRARKRDVHEEVGDLVLCRSGGPFNADKPVHELMMAQSVGIGQRKPRD